MTQNRRRVRVLQHVNAGPPQIGSLLDRPAPITTLDNPLHSVLKPSTREIVTMAFDMPLYMAPGEGLMIWILVFPEVSASPAENHRT
jgi:hypothetical protein